VSDWPPVGDVDEFDEYLAEAMKDPVFRAAYRKAERQVRWATGATLLSRLAWRLHRMTGRGRG
jgi:hypothetical protein